MLPKTPQKHQLPSPFLPLYILSRLRTTKPTQTAAGCWAGIVPSTLTETFIMFNTQPQTTFLVW